MKIYRFPTLLCCFLLMLLSACSEEFLDKTANPISEFSPENAFGTPEGLDAALIPARRRLRDGDWGFSPPIRSEYFWTDISYSSLQNPGTSRDAPFSLTPFANAKQSRIFDYWSGSYQLFKDVNIVINRIDLPEYESEEQRNAILAEAYFHRAYWYYRLVHRFGDVPWIGQELSEPKLDFVSHTQDAILRKIKIDMEYAVKWLPETVLGGKVNKAAGHHLLTKIYLSLSEFDNAIASASTIIDDGKYALMTDRFGSGPFAGDPEYDVLWDLHQRENMDIAENTETILLAIDGVDFPGASSASSGSGTDRFWQPLWWLIPDCEYNLANGEDEFEEKLGRAVSWARPNNHFNYTLKAEDPNDRRYSDTNWWGLEDFFYNKPGTERFGEQIQIEDVGIDSISRMFEFPRYKTHTPRSLPGNNNGGYRPFYVFRLAETYLLRAEAYVWKGQLSEAAEDVNVVRARAGATGKTAADMTIDYIMDERARELYTEEPRSTELARVSYIMATQNMGGYSLSTISESSYMYDKMTRTAPELFSEILYTDQVYRFAPHNIYWPIPQSAIDANSLGTINQNKGYSGFENNVEPKAEIAEED
ncbi:RagB/SusD family nutrient uptake outer membrane protein [Flagellimonas algicola]|uniref:RagB/SusD family nutrient uptake outer membrane protein n=1 Tax=Flagellimonas algicola TaxID=2583815 RepID=A0ABY2WS70_9FLAO|nr:RagB/SusD family nutrient uptake outer membrane protein [Allomuricauda algicola]TMU57501.1 RagB/SusD family nutrient uptake outer membrane protein [Allomuricauda algicola]